MRLGSALVLSVALAVGACGNDDDDADRRADQARSAAEGAGLDEDVADFLALAARGQSATYQATYPGTAEGTSLVIANDPPDRRVDLVQDGVVTEVRIVLDGEAFECTRDPDADRVRTCTRTDALVEPPGLFDEAALEQLTASLTDRREDFTFEVRRQPVAGVEATCLVTQIREGRERPELGERGEICLSPEGALLRVDQSEESLEATDYTTDIPENTFVRPDATDGDTG